MKSMKKILLLITLLFMAFTWTACSNTGGNDAGNENGNEDTATETTYPLTITDDLGNEITFDKAPEKIVSVAASNTEILFALGLNDKVIGRDEYSNYPAEAATVEVVGAYAGPNTEKIIELAPDVVFGDSIPDDIQLLLEASDIKIVMYDPTNIDGIFDNIKQIGQISNTQAKASELVEGMSTKREEILAKVKDVESKKVFIDLGGYISVGPNTFMDSMLQEINAVNIAGNADSAWPTLSLESIIEADPDVYISTSTPVADIKAVKGFESLKAYNNDNIIEIPWGTVENDMIQRPGPRVVEGLEIFAKTIYPELFK